MSEFRLWTEPVRPGALSLEWEKQENRERFESELRLASCQWDKLQAGGKVPAYTAQLIFISVIPPQQRLKAPFLLKRRRVDLLKFTWVLDNRSNYRKLYLQWASYFLVQRNKAFLFPAAPRDCRGRKCVFEWSVIRVRDYRGLSGSGRLGFKPSVGVRDKPSPASSRSPLSVWGFFIFSLVCLFVCLFLPRIYVPSHVLCAFFWLYSSFICCFLNKQTCVTGIQ